MTDISKTKIKKNLGRKTNPEIIEAINAAKKDKGWLKVAKIIANPTRKYASINLKEVDEASKEGDTIIIPGKVLGTGNVGKRVRICALGFSKSAREKLRKAKAEAVSIFEEIKKNPKAEGIKILR